MNRQYSITRQIAPEKKVTQLSTYRERRDEARALDWRRARGLLSIRDLADEYQRSHRCRDGLIAALPTDRIDQEVSR